MNFDFAGLADCCPVCHPGDHPAVLPVGEPVDDGGSLRATYEHEVCGTVWECAWDTASVWPSHDGPLPVGALLTGLLDHLIARQPSKRPETRTA
jgi:hypothetical protein